MKSAQSLTSNQLPKLTTIGLLIISCGLTALVLLAFGIRSISITLILGTLAFLPIGFAISTVVEGRRKASDRLASHLVTIAFVIAVLPLVSLLSETIAKGMDRFDLQFFTYSMHNVIGDGGGATHAIQGTLIVTGIATLISVPIGLLVAIFLVEYSSGKLGSAIRFFVDVMTGIPSIVAGLFAYALFSILIGPGTRNGLSGAIALAVLMIPYVVRSAEEMLQLVPHDLREASFALGIPKWRTILHVVLPTASSGIISGIMLTIARVMGETAPLLVTAGLTSSINSNPLSNPMTTLPVFVYYQYMTPGIPLEPYQARAWAGALTLIAIIMILNLAGRVIANRFTKNSR